MTMIHILIVILLLLVGAAALTELNPASDSSDNPLMKGLATVHAWFSEAPDKSKSAKTKKGETAVYKWQDAAGEWHFSNQPPPPGISHKVTIYRSDTNITQAPPAPEPKPAPAANTGAIPQTAAPLLPITDPERVKQLIEDAKNVQGLMDKRQADIDKQVDR